MALESEMSLEETSTPPKNRTRVEEKQLEKQIEVFLKQEEVVDQEVAMDQKVISLDYRVFK